MFPPREEFPQAVRNSEEEDAEGSFGAGELRKISFRFSVARVKGE